MADVKNMPETVTGSANSSLPLISAKTLKSAQLGSDSSRAGQRSHIIQAEVISSQKHPDKSGQSLVTVTIEGRQLQLSSEQSLSKGSQLTLQLLIQAADDNTPESIQKIQVVAINAPETTLQNTSQISNALPGGKPTNIEAALKLLAQQLQVQHASAQGQTNTSSSSTNPLAASKPSAGEIRQWLAQTLPLATLRPQTQTSALTTYSDSVRTYSASVKTHSAAPQASGTGISSQLPNNPITNLQLAALAQKALKNPETPAVVKHTLNQYLTQLTSATQSAGAKQQIHNSGLNFEAKLVSLLTSIANQVNSSANPLNTEAPSAITSNLFKNLWQSASSSATTSSNQSDTAKGSNEGRSNESRSNGERSISQILANTKSQLENSLGKAVASLNGNSEATQLNSQTNSALSALSEQLNQLQSSDLKAVLSKSLQLWLNQINAHRAGSSETQATQQLSSQLSTTLQERLPEGFRLLQGALANIESEQLQRLQQSNDQWQLSFPLLVRQDQQLNDVRAQLFKDTDDTADATGKQKKIQWRVHLHFNLEQLGPLDVEVNMRMPSLSATFWSTQASTLALLQQHLTPLRSKLSQFGVEVETLNARHGQLPERQRNQIHGNLVDIHS